MTESATVIANRFKTAQEAAATAPDEEIVRVVSNQGCDEINVEAVSYRRRDDGGFRIPRRHLTFELRNIGGITEEPLTKAQGLQSIATALHEMPDCPERDILSAALASLCEPGAD
jgi:hypothetical protein